MFEVSPLVQLCSGVVRAQPRSLLKVTHNFENVF